MSDDVPTPPGSEIVPLDEARERADDQAGEVIAQIVDDSSKTLFRQQVIETFDSTQRWPPPAAAAAGALGVAQRDLSRIDLPATYKAAVLALSECARVDECLDLRNKASALAAYARQAKDPQMLTLAARIRARAIRRCGELLREIEAARGRRTDLELQESQPQETSLPRLTRSQFADDAGLTEHQRRTALRIAAVSHTEFEVAVEAPRPATISALAQRGRVARPGPRPIPPQTERFFLEIEIAYNRDGTIEQVADERGVAVLMAAWRKASPSARQRFLQILGATTAQPAETKA